MTDDELSLLEKKAEAFSGLQYVAVSPRLQWPWSSTEATNQVVNLVRSIPGLIAEIRRLQEIAEVGRWKQNTQSLLDNLRSAQTEAAIGQPMWYVSMAITTLEKMLADAATAPAEGGE